ncbi:MAG: MoaD/ThiS family protein [Planctomycetota bacterium]|jgi:molybdopterin converting factor small subunit
MAKVVFTANLKRYTGGITETSAEGARVCDLLRDLDARIPGIRHYIVTDQGTLRQHVNIFANKELVKDRAGLTDELEPDATVHILQALSGG